MHTTLKNRMVAIATAASLLATGLLPNVAGAATTSYSQDTVLQVGAYPLMVSAGSAYDSLTTTSESFTVSVPAGEAFIVRVSGPASVLENDGLYATCNVASDSSNRMVIMGPKTVTVRPQPTNCSTAGASTKDTPSFQFVSPAAGAQLAAGAQTQVFWSTMGRSPASLRVRLSIDDGATYTTQVADAVVNNGFLNWTVPQVYTTSKARLKIEGFDQGNIVAMAVSPAFSISGTTPPPGSNGSVAISTYDYEPAEETAEAATIGIDRRLKSGVVMQVCVPETRMKVKGSDTVYYCGKDGKRYVFPNKKTYDTWYAGDFAGVAELDLADMQTIPLGGNVWYRPGVRMVKITTANEVFAVAGNGILRHVTTEAAAARLYGPNWNKMIDDLPDAFFTDYVIGEPITN